MREIEILAGCNIKEALESIKSEATRCGEVCYCKFNDSKIYSTDSLNTDIRMFIFHFYVIDPFWAMHMCNLRNLN